MDLELNSEKYLGLLVCQEKEYNIERSVDVQETVRQNNKYKELYLYNGRRLLCWQ